MAPQSQIPISANVLGTIGTVCWCIQLIPQVWHNWRKKKTDGLPGLMLFLWAACAVPLGVYSIVQNFNLPIQIQPQVFGSLALICWSQNLVYKHRWSVWKAALFTLSVAISFGGIEALLVLTLRGPYANGIEWPVTLVGVLSAVLLAAGLIPAYFELWKRNGRVIGINFVFLSLDCAGAFFSLLAIAVQNTLDLLGVVGYLGVLLLEVGIIASHIIWRFRYRRIRHLAKQAGKSYDEYIKKAHDTSAPSTAGASMHDLKQEKFAWLATADSETQLEIGDVERGMRHNGESGDILRLPPVAAKRLCGLDKGPMNWPLACDKI